MSQETAMKVYPPYCLYSFDWSQNLPGRVSICMATVVFSMFPMVRQSPINNWNITLHPFHTNICLFLVILNKSNLNNPVWNNSILNKGYEENRLCMTILCMSVLTRTFLVSQLIPLSLRRKTAEILCLQCSSNPNLTASFPSRVTMCTGKCSRCIGITLFPLAACAIVSNILLFFPNGQVLQLSEITDLVWFFQGILGAGILVREKSFLCLCFVELLLM